MSQLNTAVSSHTSYAHRANSVPLQVFEQPQNAHIIQNDAEAIQVAKQLAHEFAKEASLRDQERRLPINEIQQYSQSGLWGITIPKAFGLSLIHISEPTRPY